MKKFSETILSRLASLSLLPALALALTVAFTGFSSCNDDTPPEPDSWTVDPLEMHFTSEGGTAELTLSGEIVPSRATIAVADNGTSWVSFQVDNNKIVLTVAPNGLATPRSTVLNIAFSPGKRQVVINQEASTGVSDKTITVTGATGTSEETGDTPRLFTHSYDGDYVSHFNSKFGAITEWPFHLQYTLQTPNRLNYIMYYPRTDGNQWGSFNKFDVYVTTEANATKVKIGSFERGNGVHSPLKITPDAAIENVKTVSFEIHSAYENRVSVAEMEFHTVSGTPFDYTGIFADELFTTLKPGVTTADINTIVDPAIRSLAMQLLDGRYNPEFRVADFRPYQHPDIMAASNRLSHAYSLKDNPTGIYVEAGDEFAVMMDDAKGQTISLVIQSLASGWNSRAIELTEGLNRVKTTTAGLIYVQNLTEDPIPLILTSETDKAAAAAKTVKLHFINGKVQGYYRKGVTTLEQWKTMLKNARFADIDVVGAYSHVSWIVKTWQDSPNDIELMMTKLDDLVWQQQEFSGVVKYNKMFRNRMYFMFATSGAASATRYRTNYASSYGEVFVKPERFDNRLWVLGHEVGHINQIGMRWAGMIEVSNNLFALYNQQKTLGQAVRLYTAPASDRTIDGTVHTNLYTAATAAFITAGRPYGADLGNATTEHWVQLPMLWQLQLYVADALGKTDFYADLFEEYRTCQPAATTLSHGEQQLLFTEFCCKAANLDLTEFFDKWGLYKPIDRTTNDYGTKQLLITEAQAADTKARIAAANYPAPPHPAEKIVLIEDTNVDDYRQ
jgi:hypothetical protein